MLPELEKLLGKDIMDELGKNFNSEELLKKIGVYTKVKEQVIEEPEKEKERTLH